MDKRDHGAIEFIYDHPLEFMTFSLITLTMKLLRSEQLQSSTHTHAHR